MSINIENYLHKIDSIFKTKSQKDKYMVYIMLFSSIFAFAYLLFWDSSLNEFNRLNNQINTIKSKINNDNSYLQINTELRVKKLDKDIKEAKSNLLVFKDNNEYIKNKIETISSLIYDERTWGEYLHSISSNAKKYNVKMLYFSNKYALTNQSFGHILDINLKTTGKYKDTLNFINSLEQSELVVDIHDLNISASEKLNSDLNISVWGITY